MIRKGTEICKIVKVLPRLVVMVTLFLYSRILRLKIRVVYASAQGVFIRCISWRMSSIVYFTITNRKEGKMFMKHV